MGWVFPTSGTEEPGAKPDPWICKTLGLRFKNKCLKLQSPSEQIAKLGTRLGL